MNVFDFTTMLHEKISTSTNLQEILMLSKAIEKLNIGNVKIVSTYTDLSSLTLQDGDLLFVDDENKLYFYSIIQDKAFIIPIFSFLAELSYAWGVNTTGRLGDNTITDRSSPVSVVGGFTDWIDVSAGGAHSLGLRTNGTVWAWGLNTNGRLGDNTLTNRSSPVSVVGRFADWVSARAGDSHSLGLRANGTAWAWGFNGNGQLGDGTTTSRISPVSVVGGFTDWIDVSAGGAHSIGLRANGTAWAWGNNLDGRLGDGTTTSRSSPVSVVGGFTDWIDVSAGFRHSLGLRANGTVWAWGNNTVGQLGDNTTIGKSSPVSVVGGFTDWIDVSAGNYHSLCLRANGTLWAWGSNGNGQLGDGTITSQLSPVSVVGGFTDWASASAGGAHSLGLRTNGTVWAWGLNTNGRLGDGTTTNQSSPVSVVGGFTDWVSASAGGQHSLGIVIEKITVA